MFFSEEKNLKTIGAFLKRAELIHISDEIRAKRLSIAKEIVSFIYKVPEQWDDRCDFNIKYIGDQFLSALNSINSSQLKEIDSIYIFAYRFLCEFDFLVGAERQLSVELMTIKNKILEDHDEMDEFVRSQIIYASYFMPATITKEFVNDNNIGVFKKFEEKKSEAEKLKIEWEKEFKEKKLEIEKLKEKLDEYKTAFNFVGLYQGFSNLALQKIKESRKLFWSLIVMGLVILIPLVVKLYYTTNGLLIGSTLSTDYLLSLIPLLSVEVVLIYFFRIILLNYKSVEAQKLQIELRKTLCQFIQSYSEYAVKMRTKDSAALEKFENLIFSGILSNPEKIPSTFDGIDQIGELLKKIKNG